MPSSVSVQNQNESMFASCVMTDVYGQEYSWVRGNALSYLAAQTPHNSGVAMAT